ncbi:hypothetical protein FAM15346_001847 [Propionibacterium freudenreichii]|uniref:hypothetical protein n=1 Tax=Propionibacterium freudenreichii TaxID=1744 RepID=UPI002550BA12|nr:hypothetical protein [Propionibacterium freudenreichii]MDK9644781.1 hypothetical protein [Propionibacterium freudenreichii]
MSLFQLLATHWEELEGDFQQTYGIDLRDLWRGRLSAARCWVLLAQLPPGSRIWRMLGGPMAWGMVERAVREEGWRLASQNAGKELPRPEPPAPGWRDKQDDLRRREERRLARFMQRHAERNN